MKSSKVLIGPSVFSTSAKRSEDYFFGSEHYSLYPELEESIKLIIDMLAVTSIVVVGYDSLKMEQMRSELENSIVRDSDISLNWNLLKIL